MESANNQPSHEANLHFLDYWRIIRIRKTIILTVFLITSVIATVVTFLLTPTYSSTARIKIENNSTTFNPTPGTGLPDYNPYFIQTEFEIMQSEKVLGRLINKFNLNVEWGKKYNGNVPLTTDETMELLKKQMSLAPERNTKLIDITVYSEDKDEAARLANGIAEAYHDYRISQQAENVTNGMAVLLQTYNNEENEIQNLNTNVEYLRKTLGIVDTDPNSLFPSPTISQEELRNLNEQKIQKAEVYIKDKVQLDQLLLLETNQEIAKLRDVLPTVMPNPDLSLSTLLSQLREAEQKFVTKTNDLGSSNPDVINLQSLIAKLNQQIDDRVNGILSGLDSQVKAEKASLDVLEGTLTNAISKDREEYERGLPYWMAKRSLENKIEFHKLLKAKIDQANIDYTLPTSMVEIVDQGKPGIYPVRPKKTLYIAIGIIFGLLVGVGLAFFIEYLDTSVKTIDDVERAFQAPVLGVIPQNVGYLIDDSGEENRYSEAYRVLRTNILFSRKDEKLNTFVVVSAGAGEGKSTTSLNLATIFAQGGDRVLIVDSDLRRPTLHKILRVSNNIGLTNYLLKQNTIEEVIQTTNQPTLHFMASGKLPSGSLGILGSAQMKEMISELKKRYDYIFFDSPPILGVSDASILASEVDMAIQVIQYRRYPQPMSLRAKQLIEKVGANFIGIVLNNINMSQDESYYYYSGYYHDYYYSRSEDSQEASAKNPAQTGEEGRTGIKQKY